MMELTEWFPPDIKPIYRGVYEVKAISPWSKFSVYSWWTGCAWLEVQSTPYQAQKTYNYVPLTNFQHRQWRGLARPIE